MKNPSSILPTRLRSPQVRLRVKGVLLCALALFLVLVQAKGGGIPEPFTPTNPMNGYRYGQTATLLNDGTVLVAGGENDDDYGSFSAELYDPATGIWTPTGSMFDARGQATAVLLRDGRVLMTGGFNNEDYLASAEIYDPATSRWTLTGSMAEERVDHTCTLLNDGTVLITGGYNFDGYLASAEIYNPATGLFTLTTLPMNESRAYHTSTLLHDGTVLLAGGYTPEDERSSSETYDPVMHIFSLTEGHLSDARDSHTATLLPDGQVLVVGGYDPDGGALYSAEIYNPNSQSWTPTAQMIFSHAAHSANLLPNGQVLIIGGQGSEPNLDGFGDSSLAAAEIYDPTSDNWTYVGNLPEAIEEFSATLLPSGRILVTGGYDDSVGALNTAEIYETSNGFVSLTNPMNQSRQSHSATLLPNGTVLAFGSDSENNREDASNSAEIYDPITGNWNFTGALHFGRILASATLLSNGRVLAAGGAGSEGLIGIAELYDPETGLWTDTDGLQTPRYYHVATLLRDGEVLVTGGITDSGPSATAEIYNPQNATWRPVTSMAHPRFLHTATLLRNGQVLVTGGVDFSSDISSTELFDPITETWTEASDLAQARRQHTATLLPNGDVLVSGGYSNGLTSNTAEIYEPITDTWTDTGAMNTARYSHTATLLPNGRVVVVGGVSDQDYTNSTELYDPANGTWSTSGTLATARANHTATLLETGTVLIAGGLNGGSVLAGAEIYDIGLGFLRPDYQPQVTAATNPLTLGQSLVVSGSRFKGISEASGSNGASGSPTNYPVVQIRSIDNADELFLPVDPENGFTDLAFTSTALLGFTPGPALVTVFTNGIPSDSYYTVVELASPTLALQVPATASIGVPLTASVTISGGVNPRGIVIFQLFGPDAPNCDSEPVAFLPVSVDGNGTYTSGSYTPLIAGTYHWTVSYSGDGSNSNVGTECGAPNSTTIVSAGPPPTPTPTPTITPTATPTPTATVSPTPTPTATPSPSPSATPIPAQAKNLSSRVAVSTGDAQAIGGFIIVGGAEKRVIVRGLGPSLAAQGVTGFLADPKIDLYNSDGQLIQSNNNWRDTQEAAIQATGIAPTDDKEAAIVASLRPGNYTFVLSGVESQSGIGLTEVYDLNAATLSRIGNLSTRGDVTSGENVVIAGFILGEQQTDADIVIRGLGPSLANFNIQNVLANPAIELHDGNGNLLQSNNDWQDDPAQAAMISASQLAPTNPKEAALEVTLGPGAYTAILRSQDASTGIGLVEIYNK